MHTVLDSMVSGMGFVGLEPGRLYSLAPSTQGVETTIAGTGKVVLEDVVGSWVELKLYGRSEQDTSTGAQLLDTSHFMASSNGVSIQVNADGSITLEGTASDISKPIYFFQDGITIDCDGDMTISFTSDTHNNSADYLRASVDGEIKNVFLGKSTTIQGNQENKHEIGYLFANIHSGGTINVTVNIMLNRGSTALPVEPYTGGKPSPSVDCPQEIKSCGEKTDNLLCLPDSELDNGISLDGGMVILKAGASGRSNYIEIPEFVMEAGSYMMSVDCPEWPENKGLQIQFKLTDSTDRTDAVLAYTGWYGGKTKSQGLMTLTAEKTAKYLAIDILTGDFSGQGFQVMLNSGSTALPWEPYGYKIETEINNAGYLGQGSTTLNVKKIALKKGKRYKFYSDGKANDKNAFVFSDGNLSLKSGAEVYNYGVGTLGLRNVNKSGIVSGPCRLPLMWNPAVEIDVTADGLYLYYAVNTPSANSEDIWVWQDGGYLTDTAYQSQGITTYAPNGLLGIPVSSGGNYTDDDGQQWIADEIDLRRWKYVQRVGIINAKDLTWNINFDAVYPMDGTLVINSVETFAASGGRGFCNVMRLKNITGQDAETDIFSINSRVIARVSKEKIATLEDWTEYINTTDVIFVYELATPIESDLAADKATAYEPTTIITAAGGELDPEIEATYRKGE